MIGERVVRRWLRVDRFVFLAVLTVAASLVPPLSRVAPAWADESSQETEDQERLAELRAEIDAGRAAGDRERQMRAWRALGQLSTAADEYAQAAEAYEAVLRFQRDLGVAVDRSSLAETLHWAATAYQHTGEHLRALELLEEALELHVGLDEPAARADLQNSHCLILQKLGRFRDAAGCYEATLELARSLEDRNLESRLLNNLGGVYANLGEPEKRIEYLTAGLELRRSIGDEFGVAISLNNLGSFHRSLGELDEAIALLTESLRMFEALGNRYWLARTLNNLGYAHLEVGEPERASVYLLRAIPIRREVGDKAGEAVTLRNLGRTFAALGDSGKALAFYRRALDLAAEKDDVRGMVTARKLLGEYLASRHPTEARAELEVALREAREMGNRHEQAEILQLLGRALLASNDANRLARAADVASESLELHRAVRDPLGEAGALTLLARVARLRGRLDTAQAHLDAALAALDTVDQHLGEAGRRASFLASQRSVYELSVDVLMARHDAAPGRGFEREALGVSEQARSRALLALLGSARRGSGRSGSLDELLGAERRLSAKIQRQIDLLGGERTEREAQVAEAERLEAQASVEAIRARRRLSDPRGVELAEPQTVDARGVQDLLDRGTVLVEILLGDERSHAWWVSSDEIVPYELPPRATIEALAGQALKVLSAPGGASTKEPLEGLGRMLLGPVVERLSAQRLAIVADGALHLVPFPALGDPRVPRGAYEPLLLRHEVVGLPSASVLAEQRSDRVESPGGPAPTLAILADPVFGRSDSRLGGAQVRGTVETTDELPRLIHTGEEAEAIARLVPESERLVALGPGARRSLLLDGELDAFRILHFATHGILHPSAPELSGLVLSRFDERGQEVDGFLSLYEVSRLELSADLVVLSGCHSALGREVRGEGLVGLARGFMYAGVPAVVASHWQVRDRATARLMERFYRGLLTEGLPAAAALRSAQLDLRELRRYRDPYYWASFTLQGDWR